MDVPESISECESPRGMLKNTINKIKSLLQWPILLTNISNPSILPSGNTVDKKAAKKLIGKKDPFNRLLRVQEVVPNIFAKEIKEIIDKAEEDLTRYYAKQLNIRTE